MQFLPFSTLWYVEKELDIRPFKLSEIQHKARKWVGLGFLFSSFFYFFLCLCNNFKAMNTRGFLRGLEMLKLHPCERDQQLKELERERF